MEETVKIHIFSFGPVNRSTAQRPFWAAALLRRTSVLPQAKPRRRANSPHSRWRLCRPTDVAYPLRVLAPSILNQRVEAASGGRNPKQKATAFAVAFCFGTPEGTRIVPHEVCPDICCIKWVWLILEFISLKNIIDHYVLKGVKQFRRGKGHNKGQKSCDLSCDEQLALCSEIL